MGSGKALYDREHAGGAVARDEAKLDSLITSEGSHDVRPYAADVSNSEDVLIVRSTGAGKSKNFESGERECLVA